VLNQHADKFGTVERNLSDPVHGSAAPPGGFEEHS
jgi:hypothetical protein